MKKNIANIAIGALAVFAIARLTPPAQAQLSNMMQGMSSSSIPGMGSLTGSALPSVSSASPTNLAGVIQYCVQNNYLGGGTAASAGTVKDSLLSKFTGSDATPTSNGDYAAGSSGVLQTGNGQTASLGASGIKASVTKKVCGMVLNHAKSLL